MLRPPLLYLNVLVVATCGLVYELLAGTLASYVLGDSVTFGYRVSLQSTFSMLAEELLRAAQTLQVDMIAISVEGGAGGTAPGCPGGAGSTVIEMSGDCRPP